MFCESESNPLYDDVVVVDSTTLDAVFATLPVCMMVDDGVVATTTAGTNVGADGGGIMNPLVGDNMVRVFAMHARNAVVWNDRNMMMVTMGLVSLEF